MDARAKREHDAGPWRRQQENVLHLFLTIVLIWAILGLSRLTEGRAREASQVVELGAVLPDG
ncbi:hypothetical protein AA309_03745 [Microvirga vignae]|uniref:Uncharacterized protein n=1 Tax=Microvirga vignae TaxID=1225564 RepID=A0A0H1RNX3_9HYPH|nr:hypothetical protein AA309_03745 [Microvirga vignae]